MRFHILNTELAKRRGKRLKRFLTGLGYDVRLSQCHDLIARMMEIRNFSELRACAGRTDPSPGDAEVDPAIRAARRSHHVVTLCAAGIHREQDEAAAAKVRPTDFGSPRPLTGARGQDPGHAAFEREWGLCSAGQPTIRGAPSRHDRGQRPRG